MGTEAAERYDTLYASFFKADVALTSDQMCQSMLSVASASDEYP